MNRLLLFTLRVNLVSSSLEAAQGNPLESRWSLSAQGRIMRPKPKVVKLLVERLITLAIENNQHTRRMAATFLLTSPSGGEVVRQDWSALSISEAAGTLAL